MSFCNFIERLSYKKVNVEEGHSSQNHNSLINKNVKKTACLDKSYRRMTHLKLQKLQKGDYPPEHRLNVNVLLSNITFL